MIELRNLSKRYDDGTVGLHPLDLTVAPGELYALLGANGAGKSTAIHLLLGLIAPSSGTARIAGVDVVRAPVEARRSLAYIPEQVALYDDLDARHNVRYMARLAGGAPTLAACEAALREAGFPADALARPARLLSKGMRQKAAIASVVMKGATVLLLDEPTSGLDPKAANEFLDLLAMLRARGCAILMATHDLLRMNALADRVGIMQRSRLVFERPRAELAGADLLAIYLGFMTSPDAASCPS
jgi:ABC-2 type transport system ATP-binding protein